MTWLLLSLSSVAFFTALNLLQRVVSVEGKNWRAQSFLYSAYATGISVALFILSGGIKDFKVTLSILPWIAAIVASIFYGLFERFRFKVAKSLEASIYSTVSSFSAVVAFISGSLLYSEGITPSKLFGFILIICSLILASVEKGKKLVSKGLGLGLLTFTMLGIGWSLDKKGSTSFSPEFYNVMVWLAGLLIIFYPSISRKDMIKEARTGSWKLFLIALLNVIGYFLQLKALTMADSTRVVPIVQTSTIFTVILGILILKEKGRIPQKVLAGILAIAGVAFLSLHS
jgi:drug/metabolite transporter (DMT)-like permease